MYMHVHVYGLYLLKFWCIEHENKYSTIINFGHPNLVSGCVSENLL